MIQNKEQIINYFKSGIKETDNLKIGIEHEKFLFDNKNNRRIDYNSILKMFDQLYEFGWKPIYEKTNIIGLTKDDKSITLEPGNQIELSGAKLNNIHEACAESHEYLFELKQVIEKLNFKIISAGFDPISKLSDIPNNPKQRYEVMTKDMPEGGSLSLDMMYRTCGTQLNVDYVSEQDFTKKFKLSNYITPINIALFANSSVLEKKDSGYFSYRSHAWQQTSRGGLPEFFLEDFNFEKYADFAMNMSLLFLQRDGKYISGKNYTFKDYMNGKIPEVENKLPTENELSTHLGTIFTENRLKKYIELRSMDACGWDCLCSGPAFNTGLIYGNLDEALDVVNKWDKTEVLNAYKEVPKKGLSTQLMGKDLFYWSSLILNISKKGLSNRNVLNKKNMNEEKFLDHLFRIIENKKTNADHMLYKFSKDENLNNLYDQ
jgi:glutamate--cysteine ligase